MPRYRFLLDRDVQAVADAVPAWARVLTLVMVGLPATASDDAIIDAACVRRCIIVTANGSDCGPKAVAYIRRLSAVSYARPPKDAIR